MLLLIAHSIRLLWIAHHTRLCLWSYGMRLRRTRAKLELQGRHRILRPGLTVFAEKVELVLLGLLFAHAMTSTMLPNITFVAGHAMGTVVKVLAVHTADGAVKVPRVVFLL